MNILVIGSTGRVGKCLVQYALEAGHQVTAFARSLDDYPIQHERLRCVTGDVLYPALLEAAIPGHDVVLSVIGIRQFSGEITLLSTGIRHIVQVMQRHGVKRILTLTGAGILQESADELIMDSLSFPPNLQNLSLDHERVYRILEASGLDWTIVAPSFMYNGRRTGQYVTEADYFPRPAQNRIAAEDVADFMTREMIDNQYIRKRVGIAHPILMEEIEEEY
ncbi:MAG: SDR family oxidoreductase [Bacteroidia bacterium]|nr:SDR family oxidoreductase [Bacteroidia bacterium]